MAAVEMAGSRESQREPPGKGMLAKLVLGYLQPLILHELGVAGWTLGKCLYALGALIADDQRPATPRTYHAATPLTAPDQWLPADPPMHPAQNNKERRPIYFFALPRTCCARIRA